RRRQRRSQAADVQPAPARLARVLSRPPHRALPQGSRARRGQGPDRADHLPGQHAAMPDGRGVGGPGAARRHRAELGRLGPRDLRGPRAAVRRRARRGGIRSGGGAGRRSPGRRADAARRAPRRRRRGRLPQALAAGQRRTRPADAALLVLAAVACLHQHLRRGVPVAAGLAGGPARRRQRHRTLRAAAGRAADPVVAAGRRLNDMTADSTVTTATAPGAEYADTASAAYRSILQIIESVEPRIAAATRKELADQRDSLKLIASENYASPAALLTMGSWLSDKYAEGTIGHRFYAGCQNVDTVETVAAEHARELFGSPYAYVQPHSGIDANLVAYWAILATRVEAPGLAEAGVKNVNDLSEADWEKMRNKLGNQRLMGMSLDAGGHLTHGFRPNISGKMFHQR